MNMDVIMGALGTRYDTDACTCGSCPQHGFAAQECEYDRRKRVGEFNADQLAEVGYYDYDPIDDIPEHCTHCGEVFTTGSTRIGSKWVCANPKCEEAAQGILRAELAHWTQPNDLYDAICVPIMHGPGDAA